MKRWTRGLESRPLNAPALGSDGWLRLAPATAGDPPTNHLVAVDAEGVIRWQVDCVRCWPVRSLVRTTRHTV